MNLLLLSKISNYNSASCLLPQFKSMNPTEMSLVDCKREIPNFSIRIKG